MTSQRMRTLLVAAFAAASPLAAGGQEPHASTVDVSVEAAPSDDPTAGLPNPFEGVEAWRLPNGMLVSFKDLPKAEEVFLRATLPVGSRQDPEDLEGLAHFVEHMMFTGPDGMS